MGHDTATSGRNRSLSRSKMVCKSDGTRGPQDDEAGTETLRESNATRPPRATGSHPRRKLVPLGRLWSTPPRLGIWRGPRSTASLTPPPGVDQLEAGGPPGRGIGRCPAGLQAPAERARLERAGAPRDLADVKSGRRMVERARASLLRSGRSSWAARIRRGRRVRAASPSSRVVPAVVLPPLPASDGDRAPRHGLPIARVPSPIRAVRPPLLDHDPSDRLRHRRRDRPR